MKPLRVLNIEDSPPDHELLQRHLTRAGFQLTIQRVERPPDMESALADADWDVILCDYSMPGFSAPAALDLLKRMGRDVPFIVISGTVGEEEAVKALKAGASDYLIKDNLARLVPAIEREMQEAENRRARKELDAELYRERERISDVVATIQGVVWEMSLPPAGPAPKLDFVSEYAETLLGYPTHLWMETPDFWFSIVHEDDRGRVRETAAAALGRGQGWRIEFRWMASDGRAVWVDSQSVVVWDRNGTAIGLRGVCFDISERKRAEQQLSNSEERYRDLVENAHDIIYSHDLDGNYTSINRAGELIMGFPWEQTLAMNVIQMVAPEYRDKTREMIADVLAGKEGKAFELEIIAKDGHRVSVEVNSRLITHDGKPAGVQGIARDITARKRLEEQLLQAQKLESVGRLAGGIAHDFNNMLTAIQGFSDLSLRQLPDDHPVRTSIGEIKKAGDRSALLTNQLLAFSRRQLLRPEILDLNDVITETTQMLERVIGEDIELVTSLKPATGRVKVDPGQLSQIIMNLAINARDAMPGGGKLNIETDNVFIEPDVAQQHPGLLPGAYVKLAVSDTGTGIEEEHLAHIFEPFFTTKEVGKGTGLGLATVYGIVKQSGGSIIVESEMGSGTTFALYLPRLLANPSVSVKSEASGELQSGTETILLVEDEDLVRSLLRSLLETCGYRVIEAADGNSALSICEDLDWRLDLLITDLVMPHMSGRELGEKVTAILPDLPILFTSGYTDDVIARENVRGAAVHFIQKPFTLESVSSKVRELLDNRA